MTTLSINVEKLHRAIILDPADDAARLVYADALDEQAEQPTERAEFIRLQVELACLPDVAVVTGHIVKWNPPCFTALVERHRVHSTCELHHEQRDGDWFIAPVAYVEEVTEYDSLRVKVDYRIADNEGLIRVGHLRRREAQLLDVAAVEDWSAFPAYVDEWRWRRGFVAEISCTAADFVRHAKALFSAHPIERVTLTGFPLRQDGDTRNPDQFPHRYVSGEYVCCLDTAGVFVFSWQGLSRGYLALRPVNPVPVEFNRCISAACVMHGRRLAELD